MKMASWSSVSEHLVNPIGMSDQLKWNNHLLVWVRFAFKIPSLPQRYNILTDALKNSAKSFGL